MDHSLQAMIDRADRLSGRFNKLREGVRKAVRIADADPEMALTRLRKVLEDVVLELYERKVNEPPGTRPLENLLQRLVKDGHLTGRLDAYASVVRKLGNVGTHTHGETITVADVSRSLDHLVPILEWYLEEAETCGEGSLNRGEPKVRFSSLRVYVASAPEELEPFREAAGREVAGLGWHPVVPVRPCPTIEVYRRELEACDLVVLLVGSRPGQILAVSQGGNAARPLAAFEVEAARRRGIPVRVILAGEGDPDRAEDATGWVSQVRAELGRDAPVFDIDTATGVAAENRPGREFGRILRDVLLDHRDRLLASAFERLRPVLTSLRAVGAATVLPGLEELLRGVILPRQELTSFYRRSAPRGWELPPAESNSVVLMSECVRSLAQAPRQRGDGLIPLIRFVRLICEQVGGQAAESLQAWLDQALARLALDEADVARAREAHAVQASVDTNPRGPFHLLVQVAPRLSEPGIYSVKAWLFGTGEPACVRPGEEKIAREELPGFLGSLLAELSSYDVGPEEAWVELMLPRELLCEDVDQWMLGLDFTFTDIPIGVEHRLIVRSFERSSRSRAVQVLQERWRSLRRQMDRLCLLTEPARLPRDDEKSLALWIEGEDSGGSSLYATLKSAKCLAAAVLGCPPKPSPRDPRSDILNTLFDAGVPIVLWARRVPVGGAAAVREAMTELLEAEPFHGLPDRVWDLRKRGASGGDEVHLGRHLTLLWDDPSRTAPDFDPKYRLQPPTPAG